MNGATVVSLMLLVMLTLLHYANGLTRGRDAKEGEFPFIVRILVSEKSMGFNETSRSFHENPEIHCDDKEIDRGLHQGSEGGFVGHNTRKSEKSQSSSCMKKEDIRRLGKSPAELEKIKKELLKEFSSNNAALIAAGVLVTNTRVLTTCETVATFTGTEHKDYPLHQVLIMAGSIYRSGKSGEFKFPNKSSRHPYCHFMISTKTVLFNYGIYQVETPFGKQSKPGLVAPVTRSFKNSDEMELALRYLVSGYNEMDCHTFGWGNDDKRFEGHGMPDVFQRFTQILQTTPMHIVDYPECQKAACQYFKQCLKPILEYGFVCAKASEGGPCTEDWSAPLICNGEVFGILVEQQRCRDTGIPRAFMRVDLAFDYVFDLKSRSHTNAVDGYAVYVALLTFNWRLYG